MLRARGTVTRRTWKTFTAHRFGVRRRRTFIFHRLSDRSRDLAFKYFGALEVGKVYLAMRFFAGGWVLPGSMALCTWVPIGECSRATCFGETNDDLPGLSDIQEGNVSPWFASLPCLTSTNHSPRPGRGQFRLDYHKSNLSAAVVLPILSRGDDTRMLRTTRTLIPFDTYCDCALPLKYMHSSVSIFDLFCLRSNFICTLK